LDHYGTTLYEAIVANVPTMLYFGYPEQDLTEEAEKVFSSLKKAGIMHDNSTSILNALRDIGNRIESWWHDPKRQSARQDFLEAFAVTDKNWNLAWIKLFCGSRLVSKC